MRKCLLFLVFNIMLILNCCAQDVNYAVNTIAPELLRNANSVKRIDDTKIMITDIGHATIHHKYAITILNAAGDVDARFGHYYDKFWSIESIEGKLFDSDGKKIRTMKKSNVDDFSNVTSSNLIDDDRYKTFDFECKAYPYTIEFESVIELKGIFYLPEWQPAEHEKLSVQSSSMAVECPANYVLRYKSFNYNKEPSKIENNNSKIYEWQVENVAAVEEEQYSPAWYELVPTVFLAPADFEIDGYKGNMDTWKGFGGFIYTLNQGRDQLPENIKQEVHSLTDGITDPHQKIKILYKYLQKNTRYISVQLGIGGWQTFDANYVAKNGYGDCKALSNYMYSLLKEVGIKSNCVEIKAGQGKTDFLNDFPSYQFNHRIVCVPLKRDTVWLECTSQTLTAGYLSAFTNNRYGVLIDETGSTLIHTPNYDINNNLQLRDIKASIDSSGLLEATSNTKYVGLKQDYLYGAQAGVSKKDILEYLKQHLGLASYDVTDFNYTTEQSELPAVDEMLKIIANNYAAISGKRIFIIPNILNRYQNKLEDYQKRTCAIVLRDEYKDVDSVEIDIPNGYMAESIPDSVNLISKFGEYSSCTKVLPDKIIYYRVMERNSGRYPATDAKELAGFLDKISKADRSKVVLVKNE